MALVDLNVRLASYSVALLKLNTSVTFLMTLPKLDKIIRVSANTGLLARTGSMFSCSFSSHTVEAAETKCHNTVGRLATMLIALLTTPKSTVTSFHPLLANSVVKIAMYMRAELPKAHIIRLSRVCDSQKAS